MDEIYNNNNFDTFQGINTYIKKPVKYHYQKIGNAYYSIALNQLNVSLLPSPKYKNHSYYYILFTEVFDNNYVYQFLVKKRYLCISLLNILITLKNDNLIIVSIKCNSGIDVVSSIISKWVLEHEYQQEQINFYIVDHANQLNIIHPFQMNMKIKLKNNFIQSGNIQLINVLSDMMLNNAT
jgi:hypothetical protein